MEVMYMVLPMTGDTKPVLHKTRLGAVRDVVLNIKDDFNTNLIELEGTYRNLGTLDSAEYYKEKADILKEEVYQLLDAIISNMGDNIRHEWVIECEVDE